MTTLRRSARRNATSGPATRACRAYREPPPAPRPVPWSVRGSKARVFLFCGGLVATIAITMLLVARVAPWRDFVLDRRGQAAKATPIGMRATSLHDQPSQTNDAARPGVDRRFFEITVAYADATGERRQATFRTADPAAIAAAKKKRPIEIEYDPENFSAIRAKGEYAHPFRDLAWLPLAAAILGSAAVLAALLQMRRVGLLYRLGTATTALVERVEETHWHDGGCVYEVHYAYQTPAGIVQGVTKTTRPPHEGETIWVIYDVAAPGRSVAPC